MDRRWILLGAVLASVAVATGAWGAHGLEAFLSNKHGGDLDLIAKRIGDWKTASQYQMFHSIGLILIGIVASMTRSKWLNIAGWCLMTGIVLFTGMLYLLVLTETRVLGAVVPLGGISMIVGWIAFAIGANSIGGTLQRSESNAPSN